MSQPCQQCHKGAHHFNICVSGKKTTVGGNREKLYDPFAKDTGLAPGKYTSWDENEVLKKINSSKNSSEASFNIWSDGKTIVYRLTSTTLFMNRMVQHNVHSVT